VLPTQHRTPRTAAEAFLTGATRGWGRRDLAHWLVCHYGACVVVPEAAIERLVRTTRHEVLHLLYDLADPDIAGGRARLAIARGLVAADPAGGRAWVPLDAPRLGLTDRVASLLFADWLNAPLDYRGLVVCRGCGGIGFAGQESHAESCQPKRHDSGIAPCEIEPAPPTLRSGTGALSA
jgi:hypothetical protein